MELEQYKSLAICYIEERGKYKVLSSICDLFNEAVSSSDYVIDATVK
jgi:hypothetical protein